MGFRWLLSGNDGSVDSHSTLTPRRESIHAPCRCWIDCVSRIWTRRGGRRAGDCLPAGTARHGRGSLLWHYRAGPLSLDGEFEGPRTAKMGRCPKPPDSVLHGEKSHPPVVREAPDRTVECSERNDSRAGAWYAVVFSPQFGAAKPVRSIRPGLARIQTTRIGRSKQDFGRWIDCALGLLALARRQASRLWSLARRRGLGRNTCGGCYIRQYAARRGALAEVLGPGMDE